MEKLFKRNTIKKNKMKLALLFSGGKDSCLAMHYAMQEHKIVCLISIVSENKESYMFHVPNIEFTSVQAKAMQLPLIQFITKGEKEKELIDLKKAILEAKEKYNIQGIVTGAIRSNYQASRIQKICDELELKCFNPLWLKPQTEVLQEIVDKKFEVIISGVFAYPFDESFLGKKIDNEMIAKLKEFNEKYKINEAGEGGEIETTVLNAPFFKNKVIVKDATTTYENYAGSYEITDYALEDK